MDTLREALGTVGIWSMELRGASRPEAREAAAELDELGYPALWFPGLDGTSVLDDVDGLLTAAPRATVALGVMGIWGQDPATVGARLAALDATHGPRALIGLGISNPHSAATAGQDYGSPTGSMADYLDQLDGAPRRFRRRAASWGRWDRRWPTWLSPAPPAGTPSWSPRSTTRSTAPASARSR
jgi:alkanesulfonate monooxygenase SsuD/methylene tetrahydromethanopterin reductase-like flavin-dependent oxidoreductase (luciferase family)